MEYIIQHFPVNEGSKRVNLNFSWYDCFTRSRLSQDNAYYEIIATLFNAAVVETQIAVVQNRSTSEGSKRIIFFLPKSTFFD